MNLKPSLNLGLRGKLLIATFSILLLPIASYYYLIQLENFLKNSQEESQLEKNTILSQFFHRSPILIQANKQHNKQQAIYLRELDRKPIIDGYDDEWVQLGIQSQAMFFTVNKNNGKSDKQKISLSAGKNADALYLFISIPDNSVNYKLFSESSSHDAVILSVFTRNRSKPILYKLETESPGWFIAHPEFSQMLTIEDEVNLKQEQILVHEHQEIRGEWQENSQGYQLELSLAYSENIVGLKLLVNDDSSQASLSQLLQRQMANIHSSATYNPIIKQSNDLTQQLNAFQEQLINSNSKLSIVNLSYEIIATSGQLTENNLSYIKPTNFITHLTNIYNALSEVDIQGYRDNNSPTHIHGQEVDIALGKQTKKNKVFKQGEKTQASSWLAGNHSELLILSTAAAIKDEKGDTIGALIIEQTNASILALQDKTLEQLLLLSFVLLLSTGILLLVYSSRLISRILKLKNTIEKVMTDEGKFTKQEIITQSFDETSHDEIGQLSQSFVILFKQLDHYTAYLESMVSKLSHELGTPLSIIKSSLENMQIQNIPQQHQPFLQRALDGSFRLNQILLRMGEASRLEQALQSSDKKQINFNEFIKNYIEAIQLANPNINFVYHHLESDITSLICPELMAQLFDKLISNAISFHQQGSDIELTLKYHQSSDVYSIDVFNQGEWVPQEIKEHLFDTMVSHRSKKHKNKNNESNLGLGLHIAQLIAKFHEGSLIFINRKADNSQPKSNNFQSNGVSFILSLPIKK